MRVMHSLCGCNQPHFNANFYGQERVRRDCAYANIYYYILIMRVMHSLCGYQPHFNTYACGQERLRRDCAYANI